VNQSFPRVVTTDGPCKNYLIYWINKVNEDYLAIGCKDPNNENARRKFFKLNVVPPELSWIQEISDAGITLEGREQVEADRVYRGKNTNRIAEIIKTQTVKYKGHNVLLYLVRYSGQNMATACWLRRSDLTNARLLLRKFENEEHEKEGRFGEYSLNYSGYTCKSSFKVKRYRNNVSKKTNEEKLEIIRKCGNNNTIMQPKNQKKKKGRARIYDLISKHRKRDLKNEKNEVFKESGCVFDVLDSAYHIFPFRIMKSLISKKTENWYGLREILEINLKKYCPDALLVTELLIEKSSDRLEKIMKSFKGIYSGKHIIIYKPYDTRTGHAGLIIDGKIPFLKKYEHYSGIKSSNKKFSLVRQSSFLSDLKKNVFEVVIFKIELTEAGNSNENDEEKDEEIFK